ncbi:hypothetical protein BKE38_06885 [Pseudoroseomonas deserti]|uniref:SWIM-type domain-containing protein n=1 Tax=Teichococcus deserti TaxID=1817963 RepID=A0A1V2H4S5_9PROT|nr:SWIM zinc finger family protein [Pseudoroseomonas deserti]ONG56049.1 hypothetical protein BKE38_06885 [Pseudoroseomonas deserti]
MAIDVKAVERLATDQASLKAAAGLARPGKWSGLGASHDAALIWGDCAGSGANPYRVAADLRDLGSKCTCPSRKFPCKHGLALLWLKAEAIAPFPAGDTPDWVSDWLGRRRPAAGSAPQPAAAPAAGKDLSAARVEEPEAADDPKAAARREAAAKKRGEDTQRAILEALEALEQWVGDQLRLGLAGFVEDATARCRRIGARLVDGKAAALAGHVDELPGRLLALPAGDRLRGATVELGRLVLLARAYRAAPEEATLRRAVATAETREALLDDPAAPRVAATWEVLAEQVRTRRDGLVSQTTWLLNLGATGPRFAMLLDFFPASAGRRAAVFTPGEQFDAEFLFYPAPLPLRAVLLRRGATREAADQDWPQPAPSLEDALTAPLLQEPWAAAHPLLLPAGRIGFDRAGAPWWQADDGSAALPLAGEATGLLTGTVLTRAAALWSGNRLQLLAAQSPWGRIAHD